MSEAKVIFQDSDSKIILNSIDQNYELINKSGEIEGFISYVELSNQVQNLYHTEIEPQFEGKGLGSLLVKNVLLYLQKEQVQIQPQCPFIRAYIQKHPEFSDLVHS